MHDRLFHLSPAPCIVVDSAGAVVEKNRAAGQKLDRDAGTDWPDLYTLFRDATGRLRRDVARAAGGSAWHPSAAEISEGELDGLRLTLQMRGLGGPGEGRRHVLIWIRNGEANQFAEHTRLIRRLNRELAQQHSLKAKLEQALEKEQHLHRELIHRVKNNLSLLSSLVRQRMRVHNDDDVREALNAVELRIRSIALVHDILDRTSEIEWIEANEMIRGLCELMREALVPEHVTLNCRVDSLQLHNEDATTLCILINELVTNSLKHAFTGQARGQIDLDFRKNGVEKMELSVRDDGSGLDDAGTEQPASTGHGTQLLYALAEQLRGELVRDGSAGTHWTLIFDPKEASLAAE